MKANKLIVVIIALLIVINIAGCSNKKKTEEITYVKYIITTYSGGEVMDVFEVYSNMKGVYNNRSVRVYDSPLEEKMLFYSTLDYKLQEIVN